MALTISKIEDHALFGKRVVFAEIAYDSSYLDGGEALVPGDVGMTLFTRVFVENKSGYFFEYDYTNETLIIRFFDYDAGADGAAIGFTSTGNPSLTGVKAMFIGH